MRTKHRQKSILEEIGYKLGSLSRRQSNQQITFDNKQISQKTGKKISLDVATNEPHDCAARMKQQSQLSELSQQRRTFNVTKSVARKSILMQIAKVGAVKSFL